MASLKASVLILALCYLSDLKLAQGRCQSKANPLSGLLQNLLSPTNTEGALKLLQQVAGRSRCPQPLSEERIITNGLVSPGLVQQNLVAGCGNQRLVYPNQLVSNQLLLPNQQLVLPNQQLVLPNQQLVLPNQQLVLPNQQLVLPNQQLLLPNQQLIVPNQQVVLPQQLVLPQQRFFEIETVLPQIEVQKVVSPPCVNNVQLPVLQKGPVTTPVVVEKPSQGPAPLVNPFLPAASPVSAIAPPVSSILPPADLNNCRCNYLRKIPIPPPCL